MKATDKEISALTKKLEKARKNEEQHALEVQKSEHKIARLEGDLTESKESLGAMLKRNPWIEHEKACVLSSPARAVATRQLHRQCSHHTQ